MASLTIIYSYRNRDLNRVKNTLDSLKRQIDIEFNVLFIDYGSDLHIAENVRKLLSAYDFCNYVYNDTRGKPWNRSHAINTGIRLVHSGFIFIADVDLVFSEEFTKVAKEQSKEDFATFFIVGYLNKSMEYTRKISQRDYHLSDPNALGLALISCKNAIEIGGYDEFYSFWGMEDNDFERRLKLSGVTTFFFRERVLMYHQWHSPMNIGRKNIPKGWRIFQTDYYEARRNITVVNDNKEWGLLHKDNRKVLDDSNLDNSYIEITGRLNYFIFHLHNLLSNQSSGTVLRVFIKDRYSTLHCNSSLGNVIKFINHFLLKIKIPVIVVSKYRDQYSTVYDYRDAFIYYLKRNDYIINDYNYIIKDDCFYLSIQKL